MRGFILYFTECKRAYADSPWVQKAIDVILNDRLLREMRNMSEDELRSNKFSLTFFATGDNDKNELYEKVLDEKKRSRLNKVLTWAYTTTNYNEVDERRRECFDAEERVLITDCMTIRKEVRFMLHGLFNVFKLRDGSNKLLAIAAKQAGLCESCDCTDYDASNAYSGELLSYATHYLMNMLSRNITVECIHKIASVSTVGQSSPVFHSPWWSGISDMTIKEYIRAGNNVWHIPENGPIELMRAKRSKKRERQCIDNDEHEQMRIKDEDENENENENEEQEEKE